MSVSPHVPVLLREVLAALAPATGRHYIDGTFGAGGYSAALLDAADCTVIGIDRDPDAIASAAPLLQRYAPRLTLIHAVFDQLHSAASEPVDGVVFDVGVSSMQLDQAGRGFSFRFDGPLDMRMSQAGPSAADLVNDAAEEDLADIIYRYGEERHSRRIAREIVRVRTLEPIRTTLVLANAVRRVMPSRHNEIDPATRTFQALRIAVNDELGQLKRGLAAAERRLKPGGRLAVVSFHSLEDRVVKDFLRSRSGEDAAPSRHLPSATGAKAASFRLLSRKPVTASAEECAANPRARSAKLRAAERTEAAAWGIAA